MVSLNSLSQRCKQNLPSDFLGAAKITSTALATMKFLDEAAHARQISRKTWREMLGFY